MNAKGPIAVGVIVVAAAMVFFYVQRSQSSQDSVGESPAANAAITDVSVAADSPNVASVDDVRPAGNRDSLETSESYGALLARSMSLAESGDKEAAEIVARVLAYCSVHNAAPGKFDQHIASLSQKKPENARALERISAKIKRRCVDVNGGQMIAAEDVEKWQVIASERGNVLSLVERAVASPGSVAPDESLALIDAAVQSKNLDAVRSAANLLSSAKESPRPEISKIASNGFGTAAWEVAACRSGANCSSGSNFMDAICLSTSECNYGSYEAFVKGAMVPAGSVGEFERLVAIAQSEINK